MSIPLSRRITLRAVVGSLRLIGQRVRELRKSGLTTWTFAGERAAREVSGEIVAKSHANECTERSMADEVRAIVADGKIDAGELRRLANLPATLTRCAERSHDITEAAAL